MGFCFKNFFFIISLILLIVFSIGFVSAVDFNGSGSVLIDGGSAVDFNESKSDVLVDGGISVLNGSVSSGYVYLDSDTVFDEDFDEGFVEPLDGLDDVGVSGVDAVKTSTRVVGSDVVKYYLNGSRLVFGLKDSANNFLANKPMKVYFSNKIYNRTTDGSGMGFLNINLKPGNYSFNVKFLGDSSYSASNKVIRVTVNKMPTSITASNIIKDYGGSERLVATLKDAHGNPLADKNLTVNITGVSRIYTIGTNASGSASLAINLKPQVTNARISFSQTNYISSQKTITITINTLLASITSDNVEKFYGQATPWTARLLDKNGNPLSGETLNFQVASGSYNKTTDNNGYAHVGINFSPRNVTGTVSFSKIGYGTVSKNVNILVKAIPNTIISSNVDKYYGESTPWTARLLDNDGNPLSNKTLNFQVASGSYNKTTDDNGYAHVGINFSPRNVTGTVRFSETGYASTSKNVNILVKPIPNTIISSNVDKYYGDDDVWTARLVDNDGNPLSNKTLNFQVASGSYNKTTDADGYAHIGINFSPRNVTGTVRFSETGYASTSENVNILVRNKQSTITCSNLDTHINESRDLIAILKGNNNQPLPNKNITFNISGNIYSRTTDNNGRATYTFPQTPINTNVIVSFRENYYENSSKTVNANIKYWTSTITANNQTAYYGQAIPLTATLKGENNQPLRGKTIRISYNNKNISRTTDNNGNINYSFLENAGNYSVQLRFNENYNTNCTKTVQITVNKIPTSIISNSLSYYVNETQNLTAQLKDNNNNPLANKTLTFNVSGTIYSRTTDSNGYASINIGSNPGNYNVKISFYDANYISSNKNVNVIVMLLPSNMIVNNVSCYYGENITLSACLKGLNNINLANKNILISYNNKSFNMVTDVNGLFYFNFDEIPGTYDVNLIFNESNYQQISKTVTINVLPPHIPNVNVTDGFYNSSNLLINISSYISNYTTFTSFDNGTNWHSGIGSLCFNLSEGHWNLISYSSFNGFNSTVIESSLVVDANAPLVWASYGSGIYNESFYVNLTSLDIVDENPTIYYALDGNEANNNSSIYNEPLFISNQINHTMLSICSYDFSGHKSDVINVNYFFGEQVANLNTGKSFSNVNDAINDIDTADGDVVEVSCDLNENIILNKSICLKSCDFKNITWSSSSDLPLILLDNVNGVYIEGFTFYCNSINASSILINNSNNSIFFKNTFLSYAYGSISDIALFDNSVYGYEGTRNNTIIYNQFFGEVFSHIHLEKTFNYAFIGNVFNNSEYFNSSIIFNNSFNNGISIYYDVDSLFEDNIFVKGEIGVYLTGNGSYFKNNSFLNNSKGISINGLNNTLVSNSFINNSLGIYSEYSYDTIIKLNRIYGNDIYGLYILSGEIDASDNWWGHNNVSLNYGERDIFHSNVNLIFNSNLVLRIYPSHYMSSDGFIYRVTFCADLTYNSNGDNISRDGFVPDGFMISWNNVNQSEFFEGKSFMDFDLNGDLEIVACLDDESINCSLGNRTFAHIVIHSDAIDMNTTNPLMLSYDLPLNDSVDWISVVSRNVDVLRDEIDLIVNVEVVKTCTIENSLYHNLSVNNYNSSFFEAISMLKKYSLNVFYYHQLKCLAFIYLNGHYYENKTYENYKNIVKTYNNGFVCDRLFKSETQLFTLLNNTNMSLQDVLYDLIQMKCNLSDSNLIELKSYFNNLYLETLNTSEYIDPFQDRIYVKINYLGCSENGVGSLFNFNNIYRFINVTYINNAYLHTDNYSNESVEFNWHHGHNGYSYDFDEFIVDDDNYYTWEHNYERGHFQNSYYDALTTFTFANTKVDEAILAYWYNQSNKTDSNGSLIYAPGPMKAAYGSFLEGLMVIYCGDMVADISASKFNLAWNRTSGMVMSVADNLRFYYLTGESDFYFGRSAYGDVDDIRSFYFACSSSFSFIEHYVANKLFPNQGLDDSVTIGLGNILSNNGTLEIIQNGSTTFIHELDSMEKTLSYDSNTGLMVDTVHLEINGAYCYASLQTDWACELCEDLLDFGQYIKDSFINTTHWALDNIPILEGMDDNTLGIIGSICLTVGTATLLVSNPVGWAVGAGLIIGGIATTYYANDLDNGWNIEKGTNFAFDVGLSVMPVAGEYNAGVTIGKFVISKGGAEISATAIKSRGTQRFLTGIIENMGEKNSINIAVSGFEYSYVKFGTVESIIKTGYKSLDKLEVLKELGKSYLNGLLVDFGLKALFDNVDMG